MWISAATLAIAFVLAVALYFGALKKVSLSGKRKRNSVLALGIVLILAGAALAVSQGPEILRLMEVNSWPSASGRVTAIEVTGVRASMPQVTYTYSVNDSVYESITDLNMPGFGGRGYRRQTAHKALTKYPVGTAVTVYYNPDNPSVSTLGRGFRWAPLSRLSFGGIMFTFGLALSFVLIRKV